MLFLHFLIARRDVLFFMRRKGRKRRTKGKPFRQVSLWTPFPDDTEGSALWTPALRGSSLLLCYLLCPASPQPQAADFSLPVSCYLQVLPIPSRPLLSSAPVAMNRVPYNFIIYSLLSFFSLLPTYFPIRLTVMPYYRRISETYPAEAQNSVGGSELIDQVPVSSRRVVERLSSS